MKLFILILLTLVVASSLVQATTTYAHTSRKGKKTTRHPKATSKPTQNNNKGNVSNPTPSIPGVPRSIQTGNPNPTFPAPKPLKYDTSHLEYNTTYHGDGTYFNPYVGNGSCGPTYYDNQLVAALNAQQMNNGENPNTNPICNRRVEVTGPLGTVTVRIVDTCPPCTSGSIDMAPEAFGRVGLFATGRIKISWRRID